MKYIIKFMMIGLVLTMCTGCNLKKENKQDTKEIEKVDYFIGVEKENAPYYYKDENGKPAGFYVKLMNLLAEKKGFTYSFVETSASSFLAMMEKGNCDMFLGVLEMEKGMETNLAQSEEFYRSKLCLVTPKSSEIKEMKEFRNLSIAARAATGEEQFAEYAAVKYEGVSVVFQAISDVAGDIEQGYSKGMILDEQIFRQNAQKFRQYKVLKKSKTYFNHHRFTGIQGGKSLDRLEEGLKELVSDGSLAALLEEFQLNG